MSTEVFPRRVWGLIREPRIRTVVFGLFWAIVLGMGLSALIQPPVTLANKAGPVLTVVWGWFLVIGGVLGLAGCGTGWWWVERAAITAAATGVLVDLFVIVTLHLAGPDPRIVQACTLFLAVLSMVLRWTDIRGPQIDPSRGCHLQ